MCAIIPRQSIQDGKANGTVSKDLRRSVQGALQLAFILCRLIPLLNVRKPVGILQFIPLLKREKCLFWLLHPL
jgi:hypothetical protein